MALVPPVVSWIIPVRDAAGLVGAAVSSALAECAARDEVIVVDDGSRDRPARALPSDPRLHLIRTPPRGIAAALETGRAAARGQVLMRLDADDLALPGRAEAQLAALHAEPGLGLVGGRARPLGEVGEGMLRYISWVNGLRELRTAALIESPVFHPAVALRAEAVAQVGGWRGGDFPEDHDLWLRLLGAGWGLRNLDRDVVLMRDLPGRLTRTDPRYRRAAFRRLKQDWVARHLLPEPARVVIWGAGREGRPWIRWALAQGHAVPAVIDLRAGGIRQGVPIVLPEDLPACELLLVAVGARGARDLIRAHLAKLHPERVEGRDWWAVA